MSNIKKILCLFLIAIFLIPSNTFVSIAEKKESVNTKKLIAEVEKYVSIDKI